MLEKITKDFAEDMAKLFQNYGVSSIMGQIIGVLFLAKDPVSMEELASTIGVTKAAISTQIKPLETMGFIQKLPRGSDRKNYYNIGDDFTKTMFTASNRKHYLTLNLYKTALSSLPKEEDIEEGERARHQVIRERLEDLIFFTQRVIEAVADITAQWEEKKKSR